MITIEAREAHEAGSCNACDDHGYFIVVEIRFITTMTMTIRLCYRCASELRGLLNVG